MIARDVFTSVNNLKTKLRDYIRHYNRSPKPIKWTYRIRLTESPPIPFQLLQATSAHIGWVSL